MTLPSELQALIDQISACEGEADRLIAGLDDAGANWTPPASASAGAWSVAQCLTHLTLMNAFYLRGWVEAATAAAAGGRRFDGLKPTLPGRWFVRSLEPPARFKAKAVAATLPSVPISRAELLPAYAGSHDTYRRLVHASAAVDVNRIVRPNAIVPSVKMRLATVLLVIPAHDRRHLWQAATVRRALTGG